MFVLWFNIQYFAFILAVSWYSFDKNCFFCGFPAVDDGFW